MRKILCLSVLMLILSFFEAALVSGAQDMNAMLRLIKSDSWDKAVKGETPIPEAVFPISTWSKEDIEKLPASYWETLQKNERKWNQIIEKEKHLFQAEYGADVKNLYDLFQKEQNLINTEAMESPVTKRKTTRRLADIVYIPASQFKDLEGAPLEKIRVFAFKFGKLVNVPFDVIEFTDKNRVVLPSGPEGNPADGDGIFSKNDMIFIMASDAGHQIENALIKESFPAVSTLREIEISCPAETEQAWLYVAGFSGSAPDKSPFDHLHFMPESAIFMGALGFGQCDSRMINGNILPTLDTRTWINSPAIGGAPLDIYEGLSIKTSIAFRPIGSIKQDIHGFDTHFRAWFDGNIIVFCRATWQMKTPLGIGAPTVFNDLLVTPFTTMSYTSWYTPFDPSLIIKSLNKYVGDELNNRAAAFANDLDIRYITAGNKTGVQVDGMFSDTEKNMDQSQYSWHLFTGIHGTNCMRTYYDEILTTQSKSITLEWRDDAKTGIGYDNHLILTNQKSRTQHFCTEWNYVPFFWDKDPSRYNWNNLELILKRKDKPLSYSVAGGEPVVPDIFIHLPDIKSLLNAYKY